MSRSKGRFDAKQIVCTIIGGVFGVGLIFLIGIHVGKQVGAPDALEFENTVEASTTAEVPSGAIAAVTTGAEPDYRFFELLEAPAPKRDLPEMELAMNPVLEEKARKKEERQERKRKKKREERSKETDKANKAAKKSSPAPKPEPAPRVVAAVEKKADSPLPSARGLAANGPKAAGAETQTPTAGSPAVAGKADTVKDARPNEQAPVADKSVAAEKNVTAEENVAADARPVVEKPVKSATQPRSEGRRYTVQVSAFPDEAAANDLVKQLKSQGQRARVTAEDVPGKGTWYRVRVGRYDSREDATQARDSIKRKAGLEGFVTGL